jgi:hypothetical protein
MAQKGHVRNEAFFFDSEFVAKKTNLWLCEQARSWVKFSQISSGITSVTVYVIIRLKIIELAQHLIQLTNLGRSKSARLSL